MAEKEKITRSNAITALVEQQLEQRRRQLIEHYRLYTNQELAKAMNTRFAVTQNHYEVVGDSETSPIFSELTEQLTNSIKDNEGDKDIR